MSRIKIIKILNKDEVSKAGKPYTKCSIKTLDKNGQECWINGFGNNTTKSWSEGQEVELDIYQEEYQGQMRLKFRDVKEINLAQEIAEIKNIVKKIYEIVNTGTTAPLISKEDMANFEAKLDEEEKKIAEEAGKVPF